MRTTKKYLGGIRQLTRPKGALDFQIAKILKNILVPTRSAGGWEVSIQLYPLVHAGACARSGFSFTILVFDVRNFDLLFYSSQRALKHKMVFL